MEVKNQKMIIPILMKAQNPSEIKIGGFLPLSVQTALQVITSTSVFNGWGMMGMIIYYCITYFQITKTIYGIFTMMLGFLEENQ